MDGDIRATHAVRLGFSPDQGPFEEDDAALIVAPRGKGYDSVRDLWLRTGLARAAIERLADADAFSSLGLDRRDALWAARGARRTRPETVCRCSTPPRYADIAASRMSTCRRCRSASTWSTTTATSVCR